MKGLKTIFLCLIVAEIQRDVNIRIRRKKYFLDSASSAE